MNSCLKPTSSNEHLMDIVGNDGYVEWSKLLNKVKLPKGITFVNPDNKVIAIKKFDHLFDRLHIKFKAEKFKTSSIKKLLERICLGKATINVEKLFGEETVEEFLTRMKLAIIQNDIFLTYILNFDIYSSQPSLEKYVTDFTSYCYVLEVLTTNLMKDESLFQECLKSIDKEREHGLRTKHWREYASMFQRAKVFSILPFIPDLSPNSVKESFENRDKSTTVDDTYSPLSRIGLSINITEAVLEDLNQENYDNAKAGYELALMDGLLDFSKYSNEDRILVAPTSSMFRYSAFPRNWSDLYNAWNLTFVGNFKEAPYYAAKLLFPEVANYKDKPHQYLYPRLLGLWLHIHYVLYEATHGHDRTEQKKSNGKIIESNLNLSKETIEKLGKINLTYAKAYRKFYDNLNYKLSPSIYIPFDYFTDKCMRMFFYTLKNGMKSTNNAEKLWIRFRRKLEKYRTKWLA